MLAKVPPKRSASGSSFGALIRYLTQRDDDHQDAPVVTRSPYGDTRGPDAADRTGTFSAPQTATHDPINLKGEDLRVISESGVACQHNCLTLRTAAAEMAAVALQNARVRDAVYHVVLSWPCGEEPSDVQAFAAARHAIGTVGMEGHQYVFAVHRDTGNVHVHIAVNRVHPKTYRAVYPDRDYFKLDRAMRELELRYGWRHDNGPYAVHQRDGEHRIDWAKQKGESKEKMPQKAADMQRHGERESLFSYARGEPRRAIVAALKNEGLTWQQLHQVLGRHGLALREKGRGFGIFDLRGDAASPIKASDLHEALSKTRLERRLGAFVPAQLETRAMTSYDRFRAPVRDAMPTDLARQARADQQRKLRARYAEECAEWRESRRRHRERAAALFADIRRAARRRRLAVRRSGLDSAGRKARYSVIAFETARELAQLRRLLDDGRSRAADYLLRPSGFTQWLSKQADRNDAMAGLYLQTQENSRLPKNSRRLARKNSDRPRR